jgi:hypothetical protein
MSALLKNQCIPDRLPWQIALGIGDARRPARGDWDGIARRIREAGKLKIWTPDDLRDVPLLRQRIIGPGGVRLYRQADLIRYRPLFSAISVVQGKSGGVSPSTVTSVTASWPSNTTLNNYLIAIISGNGANPATITPPTVSGTAWTQVASTVFQSPLWVAGFHIPAAAVQTAGAISFTVAPGQDILVLNIAEFSGITPTGSVLDGTSTNSATTGANLTAGAIATTQPNDLIIGGFSHGDAAHSGSLPFTSPVPTGAVLYQQTNVSDFVDVANLKGALTYDIVNALGFYNMGVSQTVASGQPWAAVAWAVKGVPILPPKPVLASQLDSFYGDHYMFQE